MAKQPQPNVRVNEIRGSNPPEPVKGYGPFIVLVGSHTEVDPIASKQKSDEATAEAAKLPNWDGIPRVVVVEKVYYQGGPPFMSTSDLCKKFNVPGSRPKFQLFGDAAEAQGIPRAELRQPNESLRDYAARMARLADEQEAPVNKGSLDE